MHYEPIHSYKDLTNVRVNRQASRVYMKFTGMISIKEFRICRAKLDAVFEELLANTTSYIDMIFDIADSKPIQPDFAVEYKEALSVLFSKVHQLNIFVIVKRKTDLWVTVMNMLWFTHGSVNGQDFWSEDRQFGRIVHDGFAEVASGKDSGFIRSKNKWVANDGKVICTDELTVPFHNRPPNERLFDYEITIHASNGELTFGDTKEGSMAIRLNETMRLKPNKENAGKPTGHIGNSEGVRDEKTWGKRAAWCDYYGPVEGKTVGVAMLDHPQNPRHPTWWHVRDYGLFATNPFGQHDFEGLKDKKNAGTSRSYRVFARSHDCTASTRSCWVVPPAVMRSARSATLSGSAAGTCRYGASRRGTRVSARARSRPSVIGTSETTE